MIRRLLGILALGIIAAPALADGECLTKSEARHRWPRERIYWHTSAHCWDNNPSRAENEAERPGEPPAPEIAFPTVRRSDQMPMPRSLVPAPWLSPYPARSWSGLVYDFDAPAFAPWQRRID